MVDVVYDLPLNGLGYNITDGLTMVPADQFGTPFFGLGPVYDGFPSSGYEVDGETTAGHLFVASAPSGIPGVTPLETPIDYSVVAGATWVATIGVTTGEHAAGDDEVYELDEALVGHGYALTVGLATLTPVGGAWAFSVLGSTAVIEAGSATEWMADLVVQGFTSFTTFGAQIPIGVLDEATVSSISAGRTVPLVRITGPSVHPMLLVSELRLQALTSEGFVPRACRQFPRDDVLGIGSANRIHPPLRGRRVAGGFA